MERNLDIESFLAHVFHAGRRSDRHVHRLHHYAGRMVYELEQAVVHAAKLGLCPGVDGDLYRHSDYRLAVLGSRSKQQRDEVVVRSDSAEFPVVARVLRGAAAGFGLGLRGCSIGGRAGLHRGRLEQGQAGGSVVSALCGMDRICHRSNCGRG
jgi:hypothetical protein